MTTPRVDHTNEVEKTLEELIRCHGMARVRSDLAALLPSGRWQDWQRLVSITENIERRLQRKELKT